MSEDENQLRNLPYRPRVIPACLSKSVGAQDSGRCADGPWSRACSAPRLRVSSIPVCDCSDEQPSDGGSSQASCRWVITVMNDPSERDRPPMPDPQIRLLAERIAGLTQHRPDETNEIAHARAELRRRLDLAGEPTDP